MKKYILQTYNGKFYKVVVNSFEDLKSLPYWNDVISYTTTE